MSDSRYSPWMRGLHWLIFLLVAGGLALIYLRGWFPKGSALRATLLWAHIQFGLAALLVMLPRLFLRVRQRTLAAITPAPPRWQTATARLVHITLYALLFAIPLLGVAVMLWKGQPWNLLGIPLPLLPTPDRAFAHRIEGLHETLGNVLMYLAGCHAAVALFHHLVQRDDTLARMLPAARPGLRLVRAEK